jgi:hypothetical protein
LRIPWSSADLKEDAAGRSEEELLAARMIDIDELLRGLIDLDLRDAIVDELFAEILDDSSPDGLEDQILQPSNADVPLRAGRGALLALEVGVIRTEPAERAEPDVPDSGADAEQADAGPPTPRDNSDDETHVAPA